MEITLDYPTELGQIAIATLVEVHMPMHTEYEEYLNEWLSDVQAGTPNTVELGSRFAHKLFRQWRGLDEDSVVEDLHHCDGAYDGGIDLAYLERAETDESGATWYVVQSKYGSSLSGPDAIAAEGHKVLTTLEGIRTRLNAYSTQALSQIHEFMKAQGPDDRIVLVFLTCDPLTKDECYALERVRRQGRLSFGENFTVEAISVKTIYDLQINDGEIEDGVKISLPGNLVSAGSELLVGSVSLIGLHHFLSSYKAESQNLNRIFEKNVRQFLSTRVTNKKMRETIRDTPELFGMFNNGITLVVKDWDIRNDGSVTVTEPFIVNGCQTANCVWHELERRLNNGSTGVSPDTQGWKHRAEQGAVIVKIVRTGNNGSNLMSDITRYTNSQTAVKGKDFISLNQDFQRWQKAFEDKYDVYVEIQAGGWDARKARQKRNPRMKKITQHTSAQNLLKFYGAAWMKDPGTAYRTAAEFSPGGKSYESIVNQSGFGEKDLYAAWLLFSHATGPDYYYGRKIKAEHRGLTKFLFSYVVMEMVERVLLDKGQALTDSIRTSAIINVMKNEEARKAVFASADAVIKEFCSIADENSYHHDPAYQGKFNSNINEYLKWKDLVNDSKQFLEHLKFGKLMLMKSGVDEVWDAIHKD